MPWSRGRCVDLKRQRLPIRPCRQRQNRPGRQPHRNRMAPREATTTPGTTKSPERQLRRQRSNGLPGRETMPPEEGDHPSDTVPPSGNMVLCRHCLNSQEREAGPLHRYRKPEAKSRIYCPRSGSQLAEERKDHSHCAPKHRKQRSGSIKVSIKKEETL